MALEEGVRGLTAGSLDSIQEKFEKAARRVEGTTSTTKKKCVTKVRSEARELEKRCSTCINAAERKILREERPTSKVFVPDAGGHAPQGEGQEDYPSEIVGHTWRIHRRQDQVT